MTAKEVIFLIDALPLKERARVIKHVHEIEDIEVPASFKESMAEAERGELIDLDDALKELNEE